MTRIAVLGAGANGSCISADLVHAGLNVTMIDPWPDHIEAIRLDGLHIFLPDEELHVKVDAQHICNLCALNKKFDIVLICFKAYDTRWAAELIKPYLANDAIVVGMQNGMTADSITAVVGQHRTIGCVVELASQMFEPGKVTRSLTRDHTWFGIGALDQSMEVRLAEIEEILRNVGKVSLNNNIQSAKWMKLIVNAMGAGSTMLGLNGNEAMKLPGMREIMLKCGEEALRAGQAQSYTIEPIFGLTREEIEGSNQLLEMLLDNIFAAIGTSSIDMIRQDHMKDRYSEVDLINGKVVEVSAESGAEAPANQVIVDITERIRSGELKMDPSNLDIAKEMLGV